MKKIVLILGLLFSTQLAFTQAPEKINYQAVARDASGNPLVNQTLNVTYQIRQSSPTGTSVYTETHSGISTNQFGLFTAEIGGGTPSVGTFAGINWGAGLYYLYVEVNGDPMGSSQLLSVPYALYAKQSANGPQGLPGRNSISIVTPEPAGANCQNGGNKIDVGTDDNGDNILQALEIDYTYFVCNGDSGTAAGDDWGSQVVAIQGSNISGDGTTANPLTVINNDNDSTNELQDLSITGNTINISNGTGISLSPTTPTTNQVLTWNGTAWTAQNATSGADNWGSQVVVSDATLTGDGTTGNPLGVNGVLTDNQDLSLTGNSLSLTNDPTPVDLTPYLDNTDAQTLTLSSDTLTISNGNSVTLPTSPTYTAGTGIDLTGNVITNTAPDQTVALNNGTGINVTGTYPNFTINNTSPASGINITGGGITSVSGTSPNFTISTLAQTLTYTAPNLTLSNGGGTVTIPPSPWGKTGSTIHELTAGDNVGIGTTNTSNKLQIHTTTNGIKNLHLTSISTGATNTDGFEISNDGSTTLNMWQKENDDWNFNISSSGSTAISIKPNTNVGIGTLTAMNRLTVAGGTSIGGGYVSNGAPLNGLIIEGNVGIGTTAPNVNGATKALTIAASNFYVANKVASLELQGSHNGPNVEIGKIDFNSIGGSISNHARISSVNGSGTIGTSGRLLFHTANGGVLTEQVRITETGNVGIGTTTPGLISGATKYLSIVNNGPYNSASITSLELKGNTNGGNSFSAYIDFINGTTPTNIAKIGAVTSSGSTVQGQLTFSTNDGTLSERMRINQSGFVGIGTTNPGTSLEVNGAVTYTPTTAAAGNNASYALTVGDRSYIRVTTTFGGATLGSISNGLKPGQLLIIENAGGYLFTINDGAANLYIAGNALLYANDTITLIWTGNRWLEISRSDN